MRNEPQEQEPVVDAPHPNPPDARPPTHDQSDSARANKGPYASESEDYGADNIAVPTEPSADGEQARDLQK